MLTVQVAEQNTTVQVVQQVTTVQVSEQQQHTVEVQERTSDTQIIEIGVAGPQGPRWQPGPAGDASIGGHPAVITSPKNGDVLSFNAGLLAWTNRDQTDLTDGGNF